MSKSPGAMPPHHPDVDTQAQYPRGPHTWARSPLRWVPLPAVPCSRRLGIKHVGEETDVEDICPLWPPKPLQTLYTLVMSHGCCLSEGEATRPLQNSLAVRVETGLREPGNQEQVLCTCASAGGEAGGSSEGSRGFPLAREALRTWLVLIPSSLFHPETPLTIH